MHTHTHTHAHTCFFQRKVQMKELSDISLLLEISQPDTQAESPCVVCLAAVAVCNTYLFTGSTEALWDITSLFLLVIFLSHNASFFSYFPSGFLPSLQLLVSEPLSLSLSLSVCGNSGSPLPLKPAGSLKKPIRLCSGHTVPHREQQITAQELAWALRRRRAQVEACHERDIEFRKTRWGIWKCKTVRQLSTCQVRDRHAHTAVCLEICPGSMSGDTVSCRKSVDVCIRLTPSVEVKSDTSLFSQGELKGHATKFWSPEWIFGCYSSTRK